MAASNTPSWDQSVPRRPVIDDMGGGAKENHPTKPPNPVTMATAEDFNQTTKQVAALGRTVPLVRIFVTITAGVPAVSSVQAPGSSVAVGSFTVVDNGAGDTTLHWVSTLLPSVGGGACAFQTDDTEIDRIRAIYTTVGANPAVRVKTKLGAAGTDCNFGVDVY